MNDPTTIPAGEYLTIPEVAALLSEKRRNVLNWVKAGKLQGVQTGIGWLVLADSLDGFAPPKPGPKKAAKKDE